MKSKLNLPSTVHLCTRPSCAVEDSKWKHLTKIYTPYAERHGLFFELQASV